MSTIGLNPGFDQPKFKGYEVVSEGNSSEARAEGNQQETRARIFTPGPAETYHPLQAQIIRPGSTQPENIALQYEATSQLWKSPEALPLGTLYRFDVSNLPVIEAQLLSPNQTPFPAPQKGQEAATEPVILKLRRKNNVWQSAKPIPPGTIVRIPLQDLPPMDIEAVFPDKGTQKLTPKLEGNAWTITVDPQWEAGILLRVAPAMDWVEVVEQNGQKFNRISPLEANAPHKSGPMADIFLDSLLPLEDLAKLTGLPQKTLESLPPRKRQRYLADWIERNNHLLPMRNHFNRYGGNETALQTMLPMLHQVGIRSILTKPFIGGDNLSAHRYWTVDPFVLNDSFTSKKAFQGFINTTLDHGMKLYNDGAFVNQGLNGAQFFSLLTDQKNSPYWHWFTHTDKNNQQRINHSGKLTLPRLSHNGMTLGILPTRPTSNGHRKLDFNHFEFRIVNDPDTRTYDRRKPTLIELYDPSTQTKDGQPLHANRSIINSEDSVHNYRFPVSVDELREKKRRIAQQHLDGPARKSVMMEWSQFRLKEASADDSTYKWDGQTSVAKMNTKNPEVVNYLRDAVGYWTRYVSNTYTERVARALSQAQDKTPNANPDALIRAITNPSAKPSPDYALPKVELPQIETLTPAEIQQALEDTNQVASADLPRALASGLLKHYPLMALELPVMFKSILSYPDLSDVLSGTAPGGFPKFWREKVQRGLSTLPVIGRSFENFEQQLTRTFDQINAQLSPEAREKLKDPKVASLLYESLGEAVFMKLFTGLDVLDPQTQANLTQERIEEALYQTTPSRIVQNNPTSASKLLPGFMKRQLKQIDTVTLAHLMEQRLQDLDPQWVALAKAVLNKREFGLNWRLDAAKDVADMDRVLNEEPADRAPVFQEEMQFVRKFWNSLNQSIRQEFPKASLIGELTDFELFAGNNEVGRSELAATLGAGDINGAPNMSFLFSSLLEVINHTQRPDEYGGKTISPTAFMLNAAKMSSQTYPNAAIQNNQNFTSSHDYVSTAHSLLLNSDIWTMDHVRWLGLSDDLREACNELLYKPCFEAQRAKLDQQFPSWRGVVQKLESRMVKHHDDRTWRQTEGMRLRLKNPGHQKYYNEHAKSDTDGHLLLGLAKQPAKNLDDLFAALPPDGLDLSDEQLTTLKDTLKKGYPPSGESEELKIQLLRSIPNLGHVLHQLRTLGQSDELRRQIPRPVLASIEKASVNPENAATPFELKASFVDDLLTNGIPASELDMSRKERGLLAPMLQARMTEHSEDRAMRAVIVNNWMRFTEDRHSPWNKLTASPRFLLNDNDQLKTELTQSLWRALDTTIKQTPRHFGYQPLDTALNNVFANLDNEWQKALPDRIQRDPQKIETFIQELKHALYQQANGPVMDKLLRIFAIQSAMPGNPSLYLHDLFAQGGGEWLKNEFVQDRAPIRIDRLESEPGMNRFMQSVTEILGQRAQLPALTNGQLIPITADDEVGVLPIVRDNGQDQVIVLVNTGKPQGPQWGQGKVGTSAQYTEITTTTPEIKNYVPNLAELKARPGTVYRDVNTNERFKINASGQLVGFKSGRGMDINICRILQRENSSLQYQA